MTTRLQGCPPESTSRRSLARTCRARDRSPDGFEIKELEIVVGTKVRPDHLALPAALGG